MSKRKKRLEKIRRNPKNVRKDELESVLEEYGFTLDLREGSHMTYRHKSGARVTIATHKSHLESYVVKLALRALDTAIQYDTEDEEEDDEDSE